MPLATITFDLSNPEDEIKHIRAVKSGDMLSAIITHIEYLRSQHKYNNEPIAKRHLEEFYKTLEDRNTQCRATFKVMKELTQHLKDNIKLEASKEQQKEVQHVLIGKLKPKAGQQIFEINKTTGEIAKAKFKNKNVSFVQAAKGDFSSLKDLVINPDCVYIPALNEATALKKYNKDSNQKSYYAKQAPFDINDVYFLKRKAYPTNFF